MSASISIDPEVAGAVAIAAAIATVIVHVVFASGVYAEAAKARARGERTLFAPPSVWALATLVGGVLIAVAFWFVHFSPRRGRDQRDLVDTSGTPS